MLKINKDSVLFINFEVVDDFEIICRFYFLLSLFVYMIVIKRSHHIHIATSRDNILPREVNDVTAAAQNEIADAYFRVSGPGNKVISKNLRIHFDVEKIRRILPRRTSHNGLGQMVRPEFSIVAVYLPQCPFIM